MALIAGSADLILSRLYDRAYSEGIIGVSMREMIVGEGSVFVRKVCKVANAVAGGISVGKDTDEEGESLSWLACSSVFCKKGL